MARVDPTLVAEVANQARAAGMNPLDLLTIMSYETAGTLNPWQRGPTTKWGQHRGLIQWGEKQRDQYGVHAGSSVAEQVAASIKYLQDRGWKPGMGRLEMYAAINAGGIGPKYYSRSDANAGGAPGSVADKVNNQMAGHEAKAKNLLAQYDTGEGVPAGAGANGITGGVTPSSIPWGGYGYTAPPGLLQPGSTGPRSPTPDVATTGSVGQPRDAAPTAPYSVAPNSDAARMLSDPARYGLSPIQVAEMRKQLTAGGPGGGTIGNIPVPQPVPTPAPSPAQPPAGLLSPPPPSSRLDPAPTPEEREETRKYLAGMGPGPIGVWNPAKIWSQRPEYQSQQPPESPLETLKRADPNLTAVAQAPVIGEGPQAPQAVGGEQASATGLFDEWRNRKVPPLFSGGWT